MTLPISGEYPNDWKQISDRTCAEAGHRCARCAHPYEKGKHGKGQWTPCDDRCNHVGPLAFMLNGKLDPITDHRIRADDAFRNRPLSNPYVVAEWRILTVHHMDGNKANCRWWNLLPLCQRCHLTVQAKVDPHQPFMLEHSEWMKPYVAGFYAWKYEGRELTREQVMQELDRLLSHECLT